jgi:V/A-type H+-transporting ATPase subunit K
MSGIEIAELILLPLGVTALLTLPVLAAIKKQKPGKSMRRAMLTNLCAFGAVLLCAIILPLGGFASADETAEAANAVTNSAAGLGYLAAAISVGVGCIGSGIAVGHAAPAAIGALAEEPKSFAKALIFVALGEGISIFGLLVAIIILGKL